MSTDDANREPTPLGPDELDELLSAALDGELEAAALDLGLSAEQAEARIQATPGADDRRRALATARDLLAVPPPLDELLAARLRAKAGRAADAESVARADDRRRRRNRIVLSAGGIAAAVAAVVAVASGMSGMDSNPYSSSAKSAATDVTVNDAPASGQLGPAAATATPALGAFSDVRALAVAAVEKDAVSRALTNDEAKSAASTTTSPSRTQSGSGAVDSSSGFVAPSYAPSAAGATTSRTADKGTQRDAAERAVSSCNAPPGVPAGDSPVLRATATLSGKPVVVLVFAGATEHVVVIEDTNCKLINLQMFR